MKKVKRYINFGHIIPITVGTLIFTSLLIFILEPNIHNPSWVIVGTYLWVIIFMFLFFNRILPPYLKVKNGELIFVGYPWVYRIKRDWLDEVVIHAATDLFIKPKPEYAKKLRHIPRVKNEKYTGYKGIIFVNLHAMGTIIDAMRPITRVDINWDKLSPKWREYFLKKLYDEKRDLVENFK